MCHLCDGFVSRLIRWDTEEKLLFTANQSAEGSRILQEHGKKALAEGSVFFLEEGQLYTKSTAALRIMKNLPFPFSLAYGLTVFPEGIRNMVYTWIAKNRYRWFGKRDTCRMPTPEEAARFL